MIVCKGENAVISTLLLLLAPDWILVCSLGLLVKDGIFCGEKSGNCEKRNTDMLSPIHSGKEAPVLNCA